MDSSLTRPQSLQELYKTYFAFANKCQFTALLRNYIQNEEWKDKSQEPIWNILSKISDDIGAVLTDDIVNYTRNVVDIDTCKVPQLIENSKMLSYNLDHIKNSYEFFPESIKCLVDIFSINPEFLVGNYKNHILSDGVIKEILIFIRDNIADKSMFMENDAIDKLIEDPHSLLNHGLYRNFVHALFFKTLVDALSAPYSNQAYDDPNADRLPIAFNVLWWERKNQSNVLSRLDEYKSWVDRFIWNEQDHPLNSDGLAGTIWSNVEHIKNQKKMSSKFNPFKVADHIWFNGLNPGHSLSEDELSLVDMVIDYHQKPRYDYENGKFMEDSSSTRFAYYKELEWCEYVKMVMYVRNNIYAFTSFGGTYDIFGNRFIQEATSWQDCTRVCQIFNEGGNVVENANGNVALNKEILFKVSKFLCDYAFKIQAIRENVKTMAQKHAMRGTAALLVHVVNDYLLKELPVIRDNMVQSKEGLDFKFQWEIDDGFNNHGNVHVVEYEDDNEYFNIDPSGDVRYASRTNARYWEQLDGIGYEDSLGVFTRRQIHDFYEKTLGLGRLQPNKPSSYDDVQDFLVDLFKIGANPIHWDKSAEEFKNPIDDIFSKSEKDYGYSREERRDVQDNVKLRTNQENQFLEYSGDEDIVGNGLYDYVNNRLFYWKNQDYSSHVLHPFMYNLKIWNRLNNIIINGYRDYMDTDLVEYMLSKVKFDELFGEYGEGRNFWKYNVVDMSGYTTRYEAAIKDEHREDKDETTSPLTGYDGLFYPSAILDFLKIYEECLNEDGSEKRALFALTDEFFDDAEGLDDGISNFVKEIHSIYWQSDVDGTFYEKWYSHLNYTKEEYKKIAIQLWYWRRRIWELARNEYPIERYCIDIRGNSLILVQTFKTDDDQTNPYLIDLKIEQNKIVENGGNHNIHVQSCSNDFKRPCELWIRWKSNPIAIPAFDVDYDKATPYTIFDLHYRNGQNVELGQLTHTNSECNDMFKVVLSDWRGRYGNTVKWWDSNGHALDGNRLPVFFDMEQSANILALASWQMVSFDKDEDGIVQIEPIVRFRCGKNPLHIVSVETVGTSVDDYTLVKYADEDKTTPELSLGGLQNGWTWLFDSYHYCPVAGSILVPHYAFECSDDVDEEEDGFHQKLHILLTMVPAQTLKNSNFSVQDKVSMFDEIELDLNQLEEHVVVEDKKYHKYLFDHPVKVCRSTNLVFAPYESNGSNMFRCAFLGNFDMGDGETGGYSKFSIKESSCGAKTRYEYDSQSTLDLGLTKRKYYQDSSESELAYIDENIASNAFNSYDSMDKFVMVLDFRTSIDNPYMFKVDWRNGVHAASYNILGDAGFIPHFAYQSLVGYAEGDGGGLSQTWRNGYLDGKERLQFEMLGLDDKEIPGTYKTFQKMVVEDTADDCKTLLNPVKLMDDMYRVWCEAKGVKRTLFPGEEDPYGYKSRYDSHFDNEYKEYVNGRFDIGDGEEGEYIWNVVSDGETGFKLEFPRNKWDVMQESGSDSGRLEVYKELLDEYFITVVRTSDSDIMNEKRYLLPPTSLSRFFFHEETDVDGYVKCRLSPYQTSLVQDDHFVQTQVLFVGTQDPFTYQHDGSRIPSKSEVLQYGNCIKGVDSIEVAVDIEDGDEEDFFKYDEHGNIVLEPGNEPEKRDEPVKFVSRVKYIKPRLRFRRNPLSDEPSLTDRFSHSSDFVEAGQVMVILSHRNIDNLAKYHILNMSSNLYFGGSLPKNGRNQFKYSDFKFSSTVKLVEVAAEHWVGQGNSDIDFNLSDVKSFNVDDEGNPCPPYYVELDGEKWFLEQDRLVESGWKKGFININSKGESIPVSYDIPAPGRFTYAHKIKSIPERYLDYLYVKNGWLSFKVSEESDSFSDLMSNIPPFHVDRVLKNKLEDLNDVQMMKEYSTFIHQSENPDAVEQCTSFNPLYADVVLKHGLELKDDSSRSVLISIDGQQQGEKIVLLDDCDGTARIGLQLEDGEIDNHLKIYANYVKVDDGNGDFHHDLYFNIQNLFNSPFEYISSVTKQPNVLIIPDSYLYLSGDKYTNGKLDANKVKSIMEGGELSLYGQLKTYSNDVLVGTKTIRLFGYRIRNISDDKPKFVISKTYDVTKQPISSNHEKKIGLEFSDVMWTLKENQFEDDESSKFKVLGKDVIVVQPLKVVCDWKPDDDFRINSIKFDIASDVIDFNNVPELMGHAGQSTTLRNRTNRMNEPYYDRWSDRHMKIGRNPDTGNPTLELDFSEGFNFETIYLRWKLPKGCRIMDTVDRLGGYLFSSIATNVMVEANNIQVNPSIDVKQGHVTVRVPRQNTMYLGLEHSTKMRKNGYVLTGLGDALRKAIAEGNIVQKTMEEQG